MVSPVTDITLEVPADKVTYGTNYGANFVNPYTVKRDVYPYRITLEEAEQIFHALRDSIAQAKIVKTLIEDSVI